MVSKCVLVIDDEADIREIAKMSLQFTKNWTVITAASGEEGMAIAQDQQPDAILLDVMMPGMDGLEMLKALQKNPITQKIPVILLTATSKVVTQQSYVKLGAKAVLIKPFDPGLIANQVEQILNWQPE
jgi:CheY-like chemotaxis protein